jgi:hypothetical protein
MGVEPTTTCLEGRGSTAELLPQNRIYFTPKKALRQRGVPASSKTELASLIDAQEAKHLRRHDQARRLRDLRSKIVQEVQHVQRMESDAASLLP